MNGAAGVGIGGGFKTIGRERLVKKTPILLVATYFVPFPAGFLFVAQVAALTWFSSRQNDEAYPSNCLRVRKVTGGGWLAVVLLVNALNDGAAFASSIVVSWDALRADGFRNVYACHRGSSMSQGTLAQAKTSLNSLQVMRGLAALAVAAFHLSYSGVSAFGKFTSRGNLGVDFFFVLSGFIIMYAHGNDIGHPERMGRYLWRRFSRIYPIYWLYTAVFGVLVALGLTVGTKLPGAVPAWIGTITLVRLSSVAPLLRPAWTLFHEVGFYALFALLILRRGPGIAAFVVWFALCVATFHYTIVPQTRTPWLTYTAAHNLNFLAGIVACMLYRGGAPAGPLLGVCAVLFLTAVALDLDHNLLSLPAYAAAFAALISGVVTLEARGLRMPSFAGLIGDASYSIYLTHEASESLILKIARAVHAEAIIGRHGLYLATLAVTITAGVSAYVLIERPLLERLRTFRLRGKSPIPARGAAYSSTSFSARNSPVREDVG